MRLVRFEVGEVQPELGRAHVGDVGKVREAIRHVHDARQAETRVRRLRGILVVGDGLGDGVRQAPEADQVGAHVGVRGAQLEHLDLLQFAGPVAGLLEHFRVLLGQAHREHQLADVVQHAGEKRGRDLVAVHVFRDGDAMRGGGRGHAVIPQRVHAEAFHLGRIAIGEDSLAQHQRHDAVEAEQRTGARHVGDRLLRGRNTRSSRA